MTFSNGLRGSSERRRYALWLAAGLLVAGSLLFAANWKADQQEKVRMDAFRGDVADMAQISETIITDRLREYDHSLLVLREQYASDPKRFAEHIRLQRIGALADRELLIVLVDRDGYLAYTDTPGVKPGLYLGDRKYFRYFADGGSDRLYIDEPSFGRVTKRYILPLARPVYDSRGDFYGVVAISVKQESLGKFGSNLQLSEDTSITVVNHNGSVISSSHNLDKLQGTKLPQRLLVPMLKGTEGVFQGRSVPDDVERIIAYRHVDETKTDLIVYSEASPAKVLREMSQQRSVLIWTAGFTSLIIMVLIMVYLKGRNTALQLIYSLRKSKEREYETLTQTSLDGFLISDSSGRILEANDTFTKILGYTREELPGLTIMDIEAPESPGKTVARIRSAIEAGSDRFQSRCRRKDGSVIDVEISAQYVNEPDDRFFVFVRDISEIKRAEETIRKSEERFRILVNNLPVKVFIKDRESVYVDCNPSYAADLGIKPEEIRGRTDYDFYPAELARKYRADDSMIMSSGKGEEYEETYTRDGHDYWVQTIKIPLEDVEHNVTGLLGVFWDITERKKAEEEKQALEQQLIFSQKLESLGVLSGGIAHDFNNILAVIIGHCGLVKLQPDSVEDNLQQIEKAAERAADLCRRMLAYAGKTQIVKSHINVGTLVSETVTMLKSTLPQNAVIKLACSDDIPKILVDDSQFRQIVMNLIINASEAIGEAQGEIRVSVAKTTVSADKPVKDHQGKAIPSGPYVCLEVTDTGCGMDEETRQRIFDPFYTTKFTGRGLGMSAVLGIITSHDGALQLLSKSGQGTTFKVYLPIQVAETTGEKLAMQTPSVPWRGSGTVLLAEDEAQVRDIGKIMLEELGFTVIAAANGKEALELYQKNSAGIALVVTDMGMPVMNGYELVRELKKLNPDLSIIVSSGFGDVDVTSRLGSEDITGIINKPYNFDQLREVLEKVAENVMPKPVAKLHS